MITYNDIIAGRAPVSVIGLGYVGLPIAVAFAHKVPVVGFDINEAKVNTYKSGVDPTGEVGDAELCKSTVRFTYNPVDLKEAKFHIVAVPTPVREDKTPDLNPLESACMILGTNLTPGSVVVFESTVYPGVTEEVCVPVLERSSGLVCGKDFKVGYSPERINPGDRVHRLETIVKVVSGMDAETLELVAGVFELVVEAGVYRAPSIKVAEAAKVIENSQRDINIAFVNELSFIFQRLGIDTLEVLKAAGTKWNFLPFVPGLVGGHCIGIDPYYLTYRARQVGYHPEVILAGRRINDEMGRHIAGQIVKELIKSGKNPASTKVAILGFTFKENCPDTRNTRVMDIIHELRDYGIEPIIADPVADAREAYEHYNITLTPMNDIQAVDCLVIPVAHDCFKDLDLNRFVAPGGVLADIKGIYTPALTDANGYRYWRI